MKSVSVDLKSCWVREVQALQKASHVEGFEPDADVIRWVVFCTGWNAAQTNASRVNDLRPLPGRVLLLLAISVPRQSIRWFWEIVHSYNEEKQRHLLSFITGTPFDFVHVRLAGEASPVCHMSQRALPVNALTDLCWTQQALTECQSAA